MLTRLSDLDVTKSHRIDDTLLHTPKAQVEHPHGCTDQDAQEAEL